MRNAINIIAGLFLCIACAKTQIFEFFFFEFFF